MRDSRFRNSLTKGTQSGIKTAWWLSKMMFTITFFITLLKWSGFLQDISSLLSPLLQHVGLDTEGALVFITGALANIYSAIAAMATFDIDIRMATILAVMNLICHNLILETIVQKKTGSNPIKIVVLRISAAIIAAWGLNLILPKDMIGNIIIQPEAITEESLSSYILGWLIQMLKMIPMLFIIIISLNVFQQLLREYDLIKYISRPFTPLLRIFGLSGDCSFLWVVLNTLGLAYGSSVMLSNMDDIDKRDLKLLNTHAAITHSLLEDTILYAALGVSVFLLIVPRLLLSFIAVWSERLIYKN